jgi:hypothetical protein
VFRYLVQRNALNFHAETAVSDVVVPGQTDGDLRDAAETWLDDLQNGQSSQPVALPTARVTTNGAAEVRRALLLVGSPKTRKSNSHSLGAYLFERLSAKSINTETIYLHTALRSPKRSQALLDAVEAADLVTLAFPIYVDSLPAPAIEALERIAAHRRGREGAAAQLFAAIANCGFPEAQHCATALAICETFARQAGFEWAGSLALGAGEMINETPLVEEDGKTALIRESLDMAAEALAQGRAIPLAAKEIMGRPLVPHWAYRLMGGLGWLQQAGEYSALGLLRRRPYLEESE